MEFTKEVIMNLKVEYHKAVHSGLNTFIFNGTELDTKYAKYLLKYLKM